ncbi:MAG: NUDIX domain-containing protein [Prevotellaceae bacterium]|jgi:ADP-ribose pyrophosphatase YjhB (NUDIX family)|nr:NUDIX domain-containing protein [Prevotellaceae bacterium]
MKHPLEPFRYCPRCGSTAFVEKNSRAKICKDCHFQYYLNAVAAVAAFIFSPDNELLLCTRANEPHQWSLDLPGGFVDLNESAEEAIVREINEELHLAVNNIHYCFSVPNTYFYADFTVRTLDMFFRVDISGLSAITCDDDVAQAAFFPLDAIDVNRIGLPSIKQAVQRLINESKL